MIEFGLAQIRPEIDAETMAASQAVAQQIAASDWIGPLAPIAVSPFFGLALLSGAATYGPEWLADRSTLFSDASALNSPLLFWTMLFLAVLTSVPRFTKVSKPVALASENLEAYSAIIIYAAVRLAAFSQGADTDGSDESVPQAMAGILSLPFEVLMLLLAAVNVLVINGVKLFFEFLVWLVPFPSVDALLETANKALCAMLIGLYMFSPTAAAVLNLILLGACLIVFGWCYRRSALYREVIVGPALAWLLPAWFAQRGNSFRAFSDGHFAGLPRFAALTVTRLAAGDFEVAGRWLWKQRRQTLNNCQLERQTGLVIQTLILNPAEGQAVRVAHRRWVPHDAC